jgi:hypothetical protein
VRDTAFLRCRLPVLLSNRQPADTNDLLFRWRKLQDLFDIHVHTGNRLLQLGNKKHLVALKKATVTSLKRNRLDDIRFLAKLINQGDQS